MISTQSEGLVENSTHRKCVSNVCVFVELNVILQLSELIEYEVVFYRNVTEFEMLYSPLQAKVHYILIYVNSRGH